MGVVERETLKPGDHIYSWRLLGSGVSHGVFVNEGRVIHFGPRAGSRRPPCQVCGDQSMARGVISSCLDCFLNGGKLYLFEYGVSQWYFLFKITFSVRRNASCTTLGSDESDNVLRRAEYLLENGFGEYNSEKNNCENFANYCKTGKKGIRFWHGFVSFVVVERETLEPGDHIYSWRWRGIYYAHHGIFVNEGRVIHFGPGAGREVATGTRLDRRISSISSRSSQRPPCQVCGDQSMTRGVISSCLDCFLDGGKLYLFEYGVSQPFVDYFHHERRGTCTTLGSDESDNVVDRAEYLLKNGFGEYNLVTNNCEDFALYCKIGKKVGSGQVPESFFLVSAYVKGLRFLFGRRTPESISDAFQSITDSLERVTHQRHFLADRWRREMD